MYMREMGTVEPLTREGEIDIVKRIEDGINTVQLSVAEYPGTIPYILEQFDRVISWRDSLNRPNHWLLLFQMAQLRQRRLTPVQNLLKQILEDEDKEEAEDDEEEEEEDTGIDPELALEKFTALVLATKPSTSDQWIRPRKPESNTCNDNDARRIQRVPSNA